MGRCWQYTGMSLAPEGVEVLTKIDHGCDERNVQKLVRRGKLWFVPDGSMYVYYEPTHWSRY